MSTAVDVDAVELAEGELLAAIAAAQALLAEPRQGCSTAQLVGAITRITDEVVEVARREQGRDPDRDQRVAPLIRHLASRRRQHRLLRGARRADRLLARARALRMRELLGRGSTATAARSPRARPRSRGRAGGRARCRSPGPREPSPDPLDELEAAA